MPTESMLGAKVRGLRRTQKITQSELARRLGISPSYLNLLENNRRPFPADLVLKLPDVMQVDLRTLSAAQDSRIEADLLEAFGDPMFDGSALVAREVREIAASYPAAAVSMLQLYDAFRASRESLHSLAARVISEGGDVDPTHLSRLPTEEVNDLIQKHLNYFPELEQGAEALLSGLEFDRESLFVALVNHLQHSNGIEVRIEQADRMRSALRRYNPERRILYLSEVLRRGSRNFQLAYQIGVLTQRRLIDRLSSDPILTSPESQALYRVALGNYFAAAVLMPYDAFVRAAQSERYDIELLGHRFRTSIEQICHRLTTLRKSGAEGIPFHMLRIDMAGNISKRFSASGLRFSRSSGACPRWSVFEAFQTPRRIHTQISQFPDGQVFFEIAATVRKRSSGHHGPHTQFAIALGCDVSYARDMVYADGRDLDNRETAIPVGPTCRLCDRNDCHQRAYPSLQQALSVNENVRGMSFYAPVKS